MTSMKILAIADRNPQLDFPSFVKENQIDLIVTLGDLERHDLLGLTQVTDVPKIGVYGNHCSGNYMDELGIRNMHMKEWSFNGVTFGGFQGCVRYKDNPDAIMYTQEQASRLFETLPAVDILLVHCPPRGINDEEELAHQGFEGEREYIDRVKPKMVLHGHTYPSEETVVSRYGQTHIEYVNKYKTIDISEPSMTADSFGAWLLELEKLVAVSSSTEEEKRVRLSNFIDLESILDRSRSLGFESGDLKQLTRLLDTIRMEINTYPSDEYRRAAIDQIQRKRRLLGNGYIPELNEKQS